MRNLFCSSGVLSQRETCSVLAVFGRNAKPVLAVSCSSQHETRSSRVGETRTNTFRSRSLNEAFSSQQKTCSGKLFCRNAKPVLAV
jgi:hypothetical protein